MGIIAQQLCTFRLGDLLFGVDVLRVQEVIRAQPMTGVPRAHESVHGLINLRGQIVTALDLRTATGLGAAPEGHEAMNVVVRTDDGAVSLLVDEIGDVIEVRDVPFEAAPETLRPRLKDVVVGVYKLDEGLLLELDVDRATELTTESEREQAAAA